MDILKIAANSGMQVTLDGRIGRQEYRSVVGSLQALQRFADNLIASHEAGLLLDNARVKQLDCCECVGLVGAKRQENQVETA